MVYAIAAVVAVVLAAISGAICFRLGISYRKKVAEAEIGSAEAEAKKIVDEAVKTAENKKRESLLSAKEGTTTFLLPGKAPLGRESQVLRPIMIECPIVSALKRLRSAEMRQIKSPPRPIAPSSAAATIIDSPAIGLFVIELLLFITNCRIIG